MKRFIVLLLTTLAMAGCGEPETPATHPSLLDADLPRLVSAETFYTSNYDQWGHKISPDGARLAWIQRVDGKFTVHVRVLANNYIVTIDHHLPVTRFRWAADSRHLLFCGHVGSARNRHLFLADTDSPRENPRNLTPFEGVYVNWYLTLPGKPGTILLRMNLRHFGFDLYELELETGAHQLVETGFRNPSDRIFSRTGKDLGRVAPDGDGWILEARMAGGNGWSTRLTGDLGDEVYLAQYVPDGSATVYLRSNGEQDSIVAMGLNLDTSEKTVLFERPALDVARFWVDPANYEPLGVLYHDGFPRRHFFDERLQTDLEGMLGADPVSYDLSSMSTDRTRLTIRAETDRMAGSIYLADRRAGEKELLLAHPLNEHEEILSHTRPIRFEARDGLPITGYLTIPYGTDGKRLPMVLKVHGGPWSQDYWRFDQDTQFLANRGYAVLEVNFRGSSGFGKAFKNKARREFGGKMQDDLLDAVDWAVAEGYADPETIAIFGYSYGGYAALMGLAGTPGKFAAGISVVAPSDLAFHVNTVPTRQRRSRNTWLHFVGDPKDPDHARELAERSPINHAHRIERPLLIVHGALDLRVSKRHSDMLVEKLREMDIPVEYLVFPDEGHGIRKATNRVKFAKRLETFLAEHLGGRAVRQRER